ICSYICSSALNLETCFIVSVVGPGETDRAGCDGGDRKSRWWGGKIGKRCGVFLTAICGSRNRIISSHSIVIFGVFTETCSTVESYIRAKIGRASCRERVKNASVEWRT